MADSRDNLMVSQWVERRVPRRVRWMADWKEGTSAERSVKEWV